MGETLNLRASDGHNLSAWRVTPSGKAKGAVVVVQEVFGVNHHIRDVTERFARLGYLSIAPAMFDRYERNFETAYGPEELKRAMTILPRIDWEKGVLDLEAARINVTSAGKVGVIGFCYGGTMAWLGAARLRFDAAVAYYGGAISRFAQERPKCPAILHFGTKDTHIPASMVDEIRAAQPDLPVYVYDADHGFACNERAAYDHAAHEAAWKRTTEFFAMHLP